MQAWRLFQRAVREKEISLQIRLFTFFALFVLTIASAFVMILMVTGVFDAGENENIRWLKSEMGHLHEGVNTDFGRLVLQGSAYAKQLSVSIDEWMDEKGISADELRNRGDCLEELLDAQTHLTVDVLQNNQCSGSFLSIDATVNSELPDSEYSKAGIFLKRTEPNAVSMISSKMYYLRGPASIARHYGIELMGQWKMEYHISQTIYYNEIMDTARNNSSLPISRLYYWQEKTTLEGNSESGMLLCFPLISPDKTVYGICGVEESSMLFKLNYTPDNSLYPGIFATLSKLDMDSLDTDAGLIAGNSYLTNSDAGRFQMIKDKRSGLTCFFSEENRQYVGVYQPVKMYSAGSPYESQQWVLAVMVPKEEWDKAVQGNNTLLYMAIILLMCGSLFLALFISRRYIKPVIAALDMVKQGNHTTMEKTNIIEIDDLLEYLSRQDMEKEEQFKQQLNKIQSQSAVMPGNAILQADSPNLSAYQEFVSNIQTLSAAEMAVFNLYMEGLTANEIAKRLFLSMNTIKTHNKRIYMKLNVTSRKELMVYVSMMNGNTGKEEND